jgi:hypothetical protein
MSLQITGGAVLVLPTDVLDFSRTPGCVVGTNYSLAIGRKALAYGAGFGWQRAEATRGLNG